MSEESRRGFRESARRNRGSLSSTTLSIPPGTSRSRLFHTSISKARASIRGAMRIPILILALHLCGRGATAWAQEPAPVARVRLPPELGRVLADYEAGWTAGDGAAPAGLFVGGW